VEHRGLTAFDLGVNSKSPAVLNHRLECVPIKTDIFTTRIFVNHEKYGNGSYLWFGGQRTDEALRRGFDMALMTRNGPNGFSNESSGLQLASWPKSAPPPFEFSIVPVNMVYNGTQNLIDTHRLLRRRDGNVFIAVLKAGQSRYQAPIKDPFYSARVFSEGYYYPDYEATALGCVEQYQFCLPKSRQPCTDWNSPYDGSQAWPFRSYLQKHRGTEAADEMLRMIRIQIESAKEASITMFLNNRRGTQVLLTSSARMLAEVPQIDADEQWILEVQSWLERAFLRHKFRILGTLGSKEKDSQGSPPGSPLDRAWICDRALFINGDFTNTDVFGMVATTAGFLFLCVLSFSKQLCLVLKRCREWTLLRAEEAQPKLEYLVKLVFAIVRYRKLPDDLLSSFRRLFRCPSRIKLTRYGNNTYNFSPQSWSEGVRRRFFSNVVNSENELADLRTRLGDVSS
jgi:hypothetical protein